MTQITHIVLQEESGLTIKQLFDKLNISSTIVKKFKYNGKITVNGEKCTVRKPLQCGDVVLAMINESTCRIEKSTTFANLLYQDSYLYVADKPYGIATHPDKAHKTDTLGNRIATSLDTNSLHIITRLDLTTSGAVLGALDEITASLLNKMQESHQIKKIYFAITPELSQNSGIIDLPLLREDDKNKTIVDTKGKPSQTKYEVLYSKNGFSLVKLCPVTGRTHQIRAHLSAIGVPILGDTFYGGMKFSRLMLHCQKIEFVHPYTKEKIEVNCPLPPEFLITNEP